MPKNNQRTEALARIIKPPRTARYEADCPWRNFNEMIEKVGHDYGGLELNPDFQRGHVWTPAQQQHFVENALRGIISSSGFLIQFNCPNFDEESTGDLPNGLQCVDGFQRITAIDEFLKGSVRPFNLHVDELNGSCFSTKRNIYYFRIAIHSFQYRADLLSHYLDFNAGGTPHSAEEISRVRAIRDSYLHNFVEDRNFSM